MDKSINLLIIEDSEDDYMLIVRELEKAGYSCKHKRVETEKAFKQALQSKGWDAIIADYSLPKYSGMKALRMLEKLGMDIPFILVSGTIGEETAVDAMRAGAHDYIMKDKLNRLVPAIEREIREARHRDRLRCAEEALKASERTYRGLIDSSLFGIAILQDSQLVYLNEQLSEMIGYNIEELLNQPIEDLAHLIHEEDRPVLMKTYKAIDKTLKRQITCECRFVHKYQGVRNCQIYGGPIEFLGKPAIQAICLDITERKKSEADLRDHEQRLKTVIEHSSEMFYIHDLNHKFSYVSHQCMELMKYTPEEMMRVWTDMISDNPTNQKGFELTEKALKTGKRQPPYILEVVRKDGKKIFVRIDESPLKDDKGRVIGISGAARDVTERVNSGNEISAATEALKESEKLTRSLVENSPIGILYLNAKGIITYENRSMRSIMGTPMEGESPIIGTKLQDMEPIKNAGGLPHFHRLMQGEEIRNLHLEYTSIWGKTVNLDVCASPILDEKNQVKGIIVMANDITERLGAEKALKHSEEIYRGLIEQSNDAIYLLYNNKFEMVNIRFTEMFGYTEDETRAKEFNFRHLISPKSHSVIEQRMKDFANGLQLAPIYEFTALDKFGNEIECETSVSYNKYKDGTAIQGIIRNITERKEAEKNIKNSLKEKEVLLKEVHHRVKNNLQIISSLLNLQTDKLKDSDTLSVFRESQDRIRSMAMIHEKLYASSDFAHIDFRGYVESISQQLLRSYMTESLNVKLDLDIDQLFLNIDTAVPCGLIINELLSNALKHAFTANNGKPGRIWISFKSVKGSGVELRVSDNGTGMPDSVDLEHLESLGLKLVSILAEDQLNGSLQVQQKTGTTIIINFPLEDNG